jgi:hypothetical protein
MHPDQRKKTKNVVSKLSLPKPNVLFPYNQCIATISSQELKTWVPVRGTFQILGHLPVIIVSSRALFIRSIAFSLVGAQTISCNMFQMSQ